MKNLVLRAVSQKFHLIIEFIIDRIKLTGTTHVFSGGGVKTESFTMMAARGLVTWVLP